MRFLLLALFLLLPVVALAQTATPDPGIPLELAEWRAANIANLRYGLKLSIPRDRKQPIAGTMDLRFDLADASKPLVIDFAPGRENVEDVQVGGRRVDAQFVRDHIVIPASALSQRANRVIIQFNAGDASLNRNDDFLYALFVPARAHLAIPCFDQPNLKARWTLTLAVPPAWQAVSNGAETGRRNLSVIDNHPERLVATEFAFAETEPLPTYLFSFVAGDFKIETASRNGRTMRMFHRETDGKKVARNRDAIFDLHARALEYMEEYTGIPYAFGKFDFVLIPAFQFGGMEHAGKILYNATGLLLDESATQNQYLGRASVIAHETAHMWFGDLVTMRWFNDVWMKEVFANFMAAKIVNPSFPEVNHALRFLLAHYPAAYEVDRTPGANAIRQPLANLNEAGSLYGAIIYQKAPVIMRHLESIMGETTFRDGLRAYLGKYAFGNATWADLIAILDARTDTDLETWNRVWVEDAGRPSITTELEVHDGRIRRLTFVQQDTWGKDRVWPQELRVGLGYRGKVVPLTVQMRSAKQDVAEARGMPAPLYVLPNGGGWAYGGFTLDPVSRAYLAGSIADVPDALNRGAAWVTMWDALLAGQVERTTFVELAMRALPRENDEQLTQRVLNYFNRAWWRFLSQDERLARAGEVEALLKEGLASGRTASQKAAWFGALRDMALTTDSIAWLRRVWEKEEDVPGLPLAEADYTSLALELAVREVDGWRRLLDAQMQRIENPDRKRRFQFVMPALSADVAERDRWFASLSDVSNRRREPWVLEGLAYLHHPLRARASVKHVGRSLEMLWEIQKTGDIFFPKRWMDATLSGHRSREVATTVRGFLASREAGYPERLKNIVLQSADELFRAVEVSK